MLWLDDATFVLIANEVLGGLKNVGNWIQAEDFPGSVTSVRPQDIVFSIYTNHPERGIVLRGGMIARTIQSIGMVDTRAASSTLPPVGDIERHPHGTGGLIDRMQNGDKCTVTWNIENSSQPPRPAHAYQVPCGLTRREFQ